MPGAFYPRVTIVSVAPIRHDTAQGILLRSLFGGWPTDRLSQVFFPNVECVAPDWSFCNEYRAINLLGASRRLSSTVPPRPPGKALLKTALARNDTLRRWFRTGLETFATGVAPMRRSLTKQLSDLKPDVVYALLGNFWLTKSVPAACGDLGIPYFMHVTDDFVESLYRNVPLGASLSHASSRAFRIAVQRASGVAGVSPVMAMEYQARYGADWNWYTTLINQSEYRTEPPLAADRRRLLYTGSLRLNRWRVLLKVADALGELATENSLLSVLEVCAPEDQLASLGGPLLRHPMIRVSGWKRPEELPDLFRSSDILLHVESSDPENAAYTRLSFSTKLSQYMMASRPILCVGPPEAGSMRMVGLAEAGLASPNEPSAIKQAVQRLSREGERYAANGRAYAERWFEMRPGQERMRHDLVQAVSRGVISSRRQAA